MEIRPSRLIGRTVKRVIDLVNQLHQKGIHFKSITDNVDTSSASGRFFFHVMASLAQMERELIAERTKAGLPAAKTPSRKSFPKHKNNHK